VIVSAKVICLVLAIVFFGIAAFFRFVWPNENRFSLVAVGLFFFALKDALT
jgi:hypothetical protein